MQITSALRTRSSRRQGDDQAIRGLLQLLGELFRTQGLADEPVGHLVTFDRVYEVQHTALESDVQASMERVLRHCAEHELPLGARAAKAVALLELVQERFPTDARLVAQTLYDRLDRGAHQEAVAEALEELRRVGLLGYSEKTGYKIQSTSGEEWERERNELYPSAEQRSELIQAALERLIAAPEQARLDGRKFPWQATYSDRRASDVRLVDPRDPACIPIDFRHTLSRDERDPAVWVNRSSDPAAANRLYWVAGDSEELESCVRELGKSVAMVRRYEARSESLPSERRRLLGDEKTRLDELTGRVRRAVEATWVDGALYFRGKRTPARDHAGSFTGVLVGASEKVLRELYPHIISTRISATEIMQLIEPELNAPSPKFLDELGLLELENGRFVPTCSGAVPQRILAYVTSEGGATGAGLYAHFGGPPYGYPPEVVRACVAGLLRGSKVRIQSEQGDQMSAARDAGVRDVLEKERAFKNATIFPVGEDTVGLKGRARICKFFEERLGVHLDRENDRIADAVSVHFPAQMSRLREVFDALRRLPDNRPPPQALVALEEALGRCYKLVRQTEPTVREVARQLDALNDGVQRLGMYHTELTEPVIAAVRKADDVARHQLAQLERFGQAGGDLATAGARITAQLARETPWRDIAVVRGDLDAIVEAYGEARRSLLNSQEEAAEAARQRIKRRSGFATLTADQSHHVLRPIAEAFTTTDEHAVAPALDQLRDSFERALQLAEQEADARLDAILSEKPEQIIRRVAHNLGNREIGSVDELDRVLDDLRTRITAELQHGVKVRLI